MIHGTYRRLDRALDLAEGAEAERLQFALDAWLDDLASWTPRSRVEVVQACNIARHFIAGGDMFGETPELAEAADTLLACLHGIATGVRSRYSGAARSMRMLPRSPEGRQAHGSQADALGAIGRAAGPFRGGRDRGATGGRRRAA